MSSMGLTFRRVPQVDGRFPVLIVVLGGMLALQSSNDLDATKIVYLIAAGLAIVAAFTGVGWWLAEDRLPMVRFWLVAILAMAGLLVVSLGVSVAHGIGISAWTRDIAPYALFTAAPILAMVSARGASRRWLVGLLVLCGALASLSFTVTWIGRRNLTDLPIDHLFLPTGTMAAALIALASAKALAASTPRARWAWPVVAGAVLGLFFVSGSRSTLLLLVVPVGVALFGGRPWRSAGSMLALEAVIAVVVFVSGATAIDVANGGPPWANSSQSSDTLSPRVNGVGTLVMQPGSDPSLKERLAQWGVAWDGFVSSPLVGVGPGHEYSWLNSDGKPVDSLVMDTPLEYPAKFGLLGLLAIAPFAWAYVLLLRELYRRRSRVRLEYLTAVGFALVVCAGWILGVPIEDKGASFALMLVLAIGLRGLLDREEPDGSKATA